MATSSRPVFSKALHDPLWWQRPLSAISLTLLFHFLTPLQVEAELIDKLDSLVSEGKGDENYRELFGLL